MKKIEINVTPKRHAELEALARKAGSNVSTLAGAIVVKFLDESPKKEAKRTYAPNSVAGQIVAFYKSRKTGQAGHLFFLGELQAHLKAKSPDSVSRILRQLRQEGSIDYDVVRRATSLYRFSY